MKTLICIIFLIATSADVWCNKTNTLNDFLNMGYKIAERNSLGNVYILQDKRITNEKASSIEYDEKIYKPIVLFYSISDKKCDYHIFDRTVYGNSKLNSSPLFFDVDYDAGYGSYSGPIAFFFITNSDSLKQMQVKLDSSIGYTFMSSLKTGYCMVDDNDVKKGVFKWWCRPEYSGGKEDPVFYTHFAEYQYDTNEQSLIGTYLFKGDGLSESIGAYEMINSRTAIYKTIFNWHKNSQYDDRSSDKIKVEIKNVIEKWIQSHVDKNINSVMAYYNEKVERYYNNYFGADIDSVKKSKHELINNASNIEMTARNIEIFNYNTNIEYYAVYTKMYKINRNPPLQSISGRALSYLKFSKISGRWYIRKEFDMLDY